MADDISLVEGNGASPADDDVRLDPAAGSALSWTTGLLALTLLAAGLVALAQADWAPLTTTAIVCTVAALVVAGLGVAGRLRPAPSALTDIWAASAVFVTAAAGIVNLVVDASSDSSSDAAAAATATGGPAAWTLLVVLAVSAAGASVVTTRWLIAILYAVWVGWLAGLAAADLPRTAPLWLVVLGAVSGLAVVSGVTRHRLTTQAAEAQDAVEKVSVRDPLTGLVNRRGLAMLGTQIIEAARRQGDAVHCVFIDIDQLRHVNKVLGDDSGDDVLIAVGDALRTATRSTDVVARWGGDEFCVIGPGAGMAPMELERRVRERVLMNPPVPEAIWSPRVVAGGAMLAPWDTGSLDTLLGKADQEMYLRRALRRGGPARPRPAQPQPEQPEQATGDAGA